MYKVIYEEVEEDFADLGLAMERAKTLPYFVTISGAGYDIVGKFGVDAVIEGTLPNGLHYTWKKRRM